MKIYKEDQATEFGKWKDDISKFMYFDSTKEILSKIEIPKIVADYGGANGNLKTFIPNSISIDIDNSKNPDITDNILTHKGNYSLIVIRYVLHYLDDYEVLNLFKHIKKHHKKNILVIQFTNENLKEKYHNSVNEHKYFRTKNQLESLLPNFKHIYSQEFECNKEFYKNRLSISNAINHKETINAYLI